MNLEKKNSQIKKMVNKCKNCGKVKESHLKISGGQMQNYPNYSKNKIFYFCGNTNQTKFKLKHDVELGLGEQ